MKIHEAIETLEQYKGIPMLRQCCVCKSWLDRASEIAAGERENVKFVISHGICEPCLEDLYPED